MSYINKITVGGEGYNLTPSFDGTIGAYLEGQPDYGVFPLMVSPQGQLYPYMAYFNSNGSNLLFGIDRPGLGRAWGLGADIYGGIGVYIYTGHSFPTIQDRDTKSRLGRLGLSDKGSIGVYVTGDDGIYTNSQTECISLKLKTEPVTLQSGEMLRIYINPQGCLELAKI